MAKQSKLYDPQSFCILTFSSASEASGDEESSDEEIVGYTSYDEDEESGGEDRPDGNANTRNQPPQLEVKVAGCVDVNNDWTDDPCEIPIQDWGMLQPHSTYHLSYSLYRASKLGICVILQVQPKGAMGS